MKLRDPFSGRWINEYGDRLRIRRLILGSYFLAFNIASVQRPRRHWHIGKRTGNLVFWPDAGFGPFYQVISETSDTLWLDSAPDMGGQIVLVDWINWDDVGRTFRSCQKI